MSSIQTVAAQLESLSQATQIRDERIEKKLDKINGSLTRHEERIQEIEKYNITQDGKFASFTEGYKITKTFVVGIITTSVGFATTFSMIAIELFDRIFK